jgi:hypothetical protein
MGVAIDDLANSAESRPVAVISDFRSQGSPIHRSRQDKGVLLQPHLNEESDFVALVGKATQADEVIIPEISDDLIEILKVPFSFDGWKLFTQSQGNSTMTHLPVIHSGLFRIVP